jgi:hypothetical protein
MSTIRQYVFAFCIVTSIASAQLFRIDPSSFPTVTVWYIPADDAGQLPQMQVRDNSQPVEFSQHECIAQPRARQLELVVCVDISSSNRAWPESRSILDTIVNTLTTELATIDCRFHLVTFNTTARSQRSAERAQQSTALGTIEFNGGTSYSAAFEEAAHILASPSDRTRWIVFITDGLDTIDAESFRTALGPAPPRVAVIMLRNEAPESLRELAHTTGGGWLERISEAGAAAQNTAQLAQLIAGKKPLCQLRYNARATCSYDHDVQLEFPRITYGMRYRAPHTATLELSTSHVYFGVPLAGTVRDASISITARRLPIQIDSIWITGSPNFAILSPATTTLLPDQPTTLTIGYRARDTNAAWGELHIRTACGEQLVTFSVGRRRARITPSPFRVVAPERGERYFSGSDVVIRWEGIPPDDSCRISMSTDGGATWDILANDASGGRYRWKVPPLDRALEARFRIERTSVRPFERAESEPITIEPTSGIVAATDLGQAPVGLRSDTLLRSFIRNRSTQKPLVIERIELSGDHARDFGIASGVFPATIPPGGTLDVELYFRPSEAGRRSAELLVVTPGGYVRQLVWGHGVGTPPRNVIVDFGVVPIRTTQQETIDLGTTLSASPVWSGDRRVFAVEPGSSLSERIVQFMPDSIRLYQATARMYDGQRSIILELRGRGILPTQPRLHDPSRFRTVLQPTAEQLAAGTVALGTYDGVGLLGVYAPTQTLALFAGGMIPITIGGTRSTAYGIAARAAFPLDTAWSIALGGALGRSISTQSNDETTISLAAPFLTATYSAGIVRVNASVGYVFKEHRSTERLFRADVPIVGLGGDVAFAPRWKAAVDVFGVGTLDYVPTMLTVRFFGERFSIDGGVVVAVPNSATAQFAVFPVVSAFWIFRE